MAVLLVAHALPAIVSAGDGLARREWAKCERSQKI
jgi:hypothetical protein